MTSPHELNYRPPREDRPVQSRPLLTYFLSTAIGAILARGGDIAFNTFKPPSHDRSVDFGLEVPNAILVWLGLIAFGSLVATWIFRLFAGQGVRRKTAFIVTSGALNGFIGLGLFLACAALQDRYMLGVVTRDAISSQSCWEVVIIANLILPATMGFRAASD